MTNEKIHGGKLVPGSSATRAHRHDEAGEDDGHDEGSHAHGGVFGEKTELVFVALAGVFLLTGWLVTRSGLPGAWWSIALFVISYFFGGYFTLKEAVSNLLARRFEIDSLMLVAAIGAAALGEWAEGALLLFLFSLGHSLEHYAMGRARRAIEALAELAPENANVRRNGSVVEIGVVSRNRRNFRHLEVVKRDAL